jgi:hypothetical protein
MSAAELIPNGSSCINNPEMIAAQNAFFAAPKRKSLLIGLNRLPIPGAEFFRRFDKE